MTERRREDIVILGAGLAGLAAGHTLSKAGRRVTFLEAGDAVGGMSRTILHDGCRFDLGGHRFFTTDAKMEKFVKDLMGDELLTVARKSTIFLRDRYFDYPLRPFNAFFGLGWVTTLKILGDYALQQLKNGVNNGRELSLEDRIVRDFGRSLFNLYFKEYSEKVWGLPCDRISADWVARRISGLSLNVALKNALFKACGRNLPTLADHFYYPALGIGRIAERLLESVGGMGNLHTQTRVTALHHQNFTVERVLGLKGRKELEFQGEDYVSTIPLTALVDMLRPRAPEAVAEAAARLRYRDLVVVAVPFNRERVTDQSWIYIPEKKIPFGRLHEPKNWSVMMAGEGRTLLVAEYFCTEGDRIWSAGDDELVGTTVENIEKLGFARKEEARRGCVVRVPKAYPLFEVGYTKHLAVIERYLNRFCNLRTIGRGGMFQYANMDHAIESGLRAGKDLLSRVPLSKEESRPALAQAT